MELVEGVGGHHECIRTLVHHRSEGAVELAGITHRYWDERHIQRRRRNSHFFEIRGVGGIIRIPEQGHARSGNALLEKLQPFACYVRTKDGVPGDVLARTSEARHKPGPHRIADPDHDNGNFRGCLLGRAGRRRAVDRDHIHRTAHEIGRDFGEPVRQPVTVTILEGDVLAFQVAEIAQPLPERVPDGPVVDDANAWNRRLLRARGERPAAAPPSAAMNSRRFTRSPRRRAIAWSWAQSNRAPLRS